MSNAWLLPGIMIQVYYIPYHIQCIAEHVCEIILLKSPTNDLVGVSRKINPTANIG